MRGYNGLCKGLPRLQQLNSEIFCPVPDIQRRIDAIIASFGCSTIGIHIRRGDHKAIIADSPIHLFRQRMEQLLTASPETKFFLATDDQKVKDMITNEFGNSVISIPNATLERHSLEGMREAVVELFCLGHCQRIIGSSLSTFSLFAQSLRRIPFEHIGLSSKQ